MVPVYINKLLVITNNGFADHLKFPEKFLQKLAETILKVNTEMPFLDAQKLMSLAYGLVRID